MLRKKSDKTVFTLCKQPHKNTYLYSRKGSKKNENRKGTVVSFSCSCKWGPRGAGDPPAPRSPILGAGRDPSSVPGLASGRPSWARRDSSPPGRPCSQLQRPVSPLTGTGMKVKIVQRAERGARLPNLTGFKSNKKRCALRVMHIIRAIVQKEKPRALPTRRPGEGLAQADAHSVKYEILSFQKVIPTSIFQRFIFKSLNPKFHDPHFLKIAFSMS